MARTIEQFPFPSAWNVKPNHVQVHAQIMYPSLFYPSGIQTGKHCVPGPLAAKGRTRSLEVFTSSGDQELSRSASGTAIDAQLNCFSPGRRSMIDTDANTLSSHQNHLPPLPQRVPIRSNDLPTTSSHSSASVYTLDHALRTRVELREANSRNRDKIFERVTSQLITNIEICDDNAWANRHADWLESVLMSLPSCVAPVYSEHIKTAIRKANITCRDQFVQRFRDMNLPRAVVVVLSKILSNLDTECRSNLNFDRKIILESQDAQTLQIHESNSFHGSNDAAAATAVAVGVSEVSEVDNHGTDDKESDEERSIADEGQRESMLRNPAQAAQKKSFKNLRRGNPYRV
jgi:hypothetical protein